MAGLCRRLWLPSWFSVPWVFNNSPTVSPAKPPHTITPPPPRVMVGNTHADTIRLPSMRPTKTMLLGPEISDLDWSDQSTDFLLFNVYSLYIFAQTVLLIFLVSLSSDCFAVIRPWWPDSHCLLPTVDLLELCETFMSTLIWVAVNWQFLKYGYCNELIFCSRVNSWSFCPGVILMRASFIIMFDGF